MILYILNPIVECVIAVSFAFQMFFKSYKSECFITGHSLTKLSSCIQLWPQSEHYLFLYTSVVKASTSDILIGKINFYISYIVLNASFVLLNYNLSHFLLFLQNIF